MYIGALGKITGMSIKTIRHYEEIGLIKSPTRKGSYRVYDESYIPVLNMIRLAKSLGFTLNELKEIVKAKSEEGYLPMDLLKREITLKKEKTNQKITQLNEILSGLDGLEKMAFEHNKCLLEKISLNN